MIPKAIFILTPSLRMQKREASKELTVTCIGRTGIVGGSGAGAGLQKGLQVYGD